MRSFVWICVGLGGSMGCHEVSSSGAYGLKGVLVDAGGAPIGNQRIVSEDHGVVTESDGSFNIRWKDPTTFVDFQRDGVRWRRRWLPESDTGVVTIELPETKEGNLSCRTEHECVAEIRWELPNGLSAHVDMPCKGKTAPLRIQGMPTAAPVVNCPTILGDLPLDVRVDRGDVLIQSTPSPLPFSYVGDKAAGECAARLINGKVVEGVGTFGLLPSKQTFAWAECEHRAGPPIVVNPMVIGTTAADAKVELPWFSKGPKLVVKTPLEEPRTLLLVHRNEQGEVLWELTLEPVPDALGTYLLPPLPRGNYRLGFGATKLLATMNPPEPEVPGEVWLYLGEGEWGTEGGLLGALRLEEDMSVGELVLDVNSAGSTSQMVRRPGTTGPGR